MLRNVREWYFEQDGWVQSNNLNIIYDPSTDVDRQLFASVDGQLSDPDDESDENKDDSVSFKGAINAEPSMNDYVGVIVLGRRSNNLHANAMDYDMTAFYPSIKIASNMDPITLQWKAMFINDEFTSGQMVNRSLNQTYVEKDKNNKWRKNDITGEAVNTYVSDNVMVFVYNYLNAPSISTIYQRVREGIFGKS